MNDHSIDSAYTWSQKAEREKMDCVYTWSEKAECDKMDMCNCAQRWGEGNRYTQIFGQ